MTGLAATRTILGTEARAFRNRLFKRGPVRVVLLAVLLVGATITIGGAAFTGGAAIGHLLPSALDSVLSGGFTALTVSMLILGFPTVIAAFFVGRDLLQLVIAPVRTSEIFIARVLLAMSANLLVSAILFAAVLGLGVGAGASAGYFLLSLPIVAIQVLLITSLQAILMSVVLRWVPARLARDISAAVAGLAGAGLYLTWNLSLRGSFARNSNPDLSTLSTFGRRFDLLPSAWPGHALSNLAAGNLGAAALWALAMVALTGVAVVVAERLYERTLLAGLGVFGSTPVLWRRKAKAGRASSSDLQGTPAAGPRAAVGTGSPLAAIARKDWLGYRRDIRRLTRLLPALLFPIGYAVALSQPARNVNGFWANVFLVSFLSLFMSTALAAPSIPSERRGFHLLRLAPLTMWEVLRSKVLLTLPPVLAVMFLFSGAVAVASGSGPAELLELGLLVVWLGCGFVTIAVSSGGIDPRFEALDDRRAVGLLGTLTGIGGSLGFGALSIGALALFLFGTTVIAGTAHLGFIAPSPALGVLMWVVGLALLAGAVTLAGVMLWFADVRLKGFEGAIAEG